MALIIYPLENWNSFLSEIEADGFMVHHPENGDWANKTTEAKEHLLKQTASQIRFCKNIKLPEANETDLREGHAHLLLYAARNDLTEFDANNRAVTYEKAGELAQAFDANKKQSSALTIPPMAELYLSQYGCKSGNSGFSQTYAGRS